MRKLIRNGLVAGVLALSALGMSSAMAARVYVCENIIKVTVYDSASDTTTTIIIGINCEEL